MLSCQAVKHATGDKQTRGQSLWCRVSTSSSHRSRGDDMWVTDRFVSRWLPNRGEGSSTAPLPLSAAPHGWPSPFNPLALNKPHTPHATIHWPLISPSSWSPPPVQKPPGLSSALAGTANLDGGRPPSCQRTQERAALIASVVKLRDPDKPPLPKLSI